MVPEAGRDVVVNVLVARMRHEVLWLWKGDEAELGLRHRRLRQRCEHCNAAMSLMAVDLNTIVYPLYCSKPLRGVNINVPYTIYDALSN